MNGDSLPIMLTIIGVGITLLGTSAGLFWKLGSIDKAVQGLAGVWDHVSSNENRLTKIETEHKCCPVCNRDKGGE